MLSVTRRFAPLHRTGVRCTSGFANWDFSWIRNEFPKPYAPGSADRANLQAEIDALLRAEPEEIPCIINGEEVYTGVIEEDTMPTNHSKVIARFHCGGEKEIRAAIDAARVGRTRCCRDDDALLPRKYS